MKMTQAIQQTNEERYDIALRGHHLWLVYWAEEARRKGTDIKEYFNEILNGQYGSQTIEHTIKVINDILLNPELRIKIINSLDIICDICDHEKKKSGKCLDEETRNSDWHSVTIDFNIAEYPEKTADFIVKAGDLLKKFYFGGGVEEMKRTWGYNILKIYIQK